MTLQKSDFFKIIKLLKKKDVAMPERHYSNNTALSENIWDEKTIKYP